MFCKRFAPTVVVTSFLLFGCAAHPATGDHSNAPTTDCPKLLQQSRSSGIDYVPTLRKAAKGDEPSLRSLLELTGSEHFTTDAEQCHIEALAEVLKRLGDQKFSSVLSSEPGDVRRAVVNGLVIELDNYPSAETSRAAFADQFPLTAATVSP